MALGDRSPIWDPLWWLPIAKSKSPLDADDAAGEADQECGFGFWSFMPRMRGARSDNVVFHQFGFGNTIRHFRVSSNQAWAY